MNQRSLLDKLDKDHSETVNNLDNFMAVDPLPASRILELKAEFMLEVEQLSPKLARKATMMKRAASIIEPKDATEDGSFVIESEEELTSLDSEDASMKDIIGRINALSEMIPERFKKFQKEIDERKKVNDAKVKRLVKDYSDKADKKAKHNGGKIDKLQKGLQ